MSFSGYAQKEKSGLLGGWQKRFFVLNGRNLQYYNSDKDVSFPFSGGLPHLLFHPDEGAKLWSLVPGHAHIWA
jgi:hypothetical protein